MTTKIDQAFLEKVAKIHNTDYPKEYWENGGHMTTEKQETMKINYKNVKFDGEWAICKPFFDEDGHKGTARMKTTDFIESLVKKAVQKAREEMAQEIIENISLSISKNTYVTIGTSDQTEGYKYGLDKSKNIVAKYLPSGKAGGVKCHCLEALSGGKHHEHCTEKSKKPK